MRHRQTILKFGETIQASGPDHCLYCITLFGRFNLISKDASRAASQGIFKVTSSTEANFIFQSTLLRISNHG